MSGKKSNERKSLKLQHSKTGFVETIREMSIRYSFEVEIKIITATVIACLLLFMSSILSWIFCSIFCWTLGWILSLIFTWTLNWMCSWIFNWIVCCILKWIPSSAVRRIAIWVPSWIPTWFHNWFYRWIYSSIHTWMLSWMLPNFKTTNPSLCISRESVLNSASTKEKMNKSRQQNKQHGDDKKVATIRPSSILKSLRETSNEKAIERTFISDPNSLSLTREILPRVGRDEHNCMGIMKLWYRVRFSLKGTSFPVIKKDGNVEVAICGMNQASDICLNLNNKRDVTA